MATLKKRTYLQSLFQVFIIAISMLTLAEAQLKLDVSKESEKSRPVGLVQSEGISAKTLEVVMNDLQRSGRFSPKNLAYELGHISDVNAISPDRWRTYGVNYVVHFNKVNNRAFRVSVSDGMTNRAWGNREYTFTSQNSSEERRQAHQIADYIYESILGKKGAFDSRMAYVSQTGRHFSLVIADSDGANPQVILESREPILSPSWSPDGSKLAYASLEGRRNQIMIQDLYTGKRSVVISMPGINSAPSWSPDGRRLVFTLSKDGNPEIYTANIDGSNLKRLTNHWGIDTEPVWSSDGMIYFTSDRGGNPQIYKMDENGGNATRVTFQGNYNGNATISRDGGKLAVMQRIDQRGFGIAVIDLKTGAVKRITNGGKDESPSFASNGDMLIFSDGRGTLKTISSDGNNLMNFPGISRDVRKPDWSPSIK